MEFTGERFIPGTVTSGIYYEHVHRYLFARQFVSGKRVLDIGCGAGYGSAMLAQEAAEVVGLDISEEAIAHATAQYPRNNLRFLCANGGEIPLPDGSYDVVTAFEMIEHVPDPDALLREAKRLLAPGGLFIVSSPNKLVYSDLPNYHNPYHIKEFYLDEFDEKLQEYFGSVDLIGQRLASGSYLWDFKRTPEKVNVWAVEGDATPPVLAPEGPAVVYAIALCAHESGSTHLEPGNSYLMLDNQDAVIRAQEHHIQDMMHHMGSKDHHIQDMMHHMASKDHHIQDMMHHMTSKDARIQELEALVSASKATFNLARAENELQDIKTSVWYRALRKLKLYRPRQLPKPMQDMPYVSVILVNYNGKKFLDECLASLEAQTYPRDRFEVLIVDNGSSDGSVEYIRERFSWIRLIATGQNLGFAGGNNVGFQHAKGELIALLNNDTTVDPCWLEALVEALQEEPGVGASTSKILFKERPGIINNVGLQLYRDGSGGDRGFHHEDRGQFDEPAEVFGACGASVLLRKELLDDIGPFDERFFMYYEDLDLAWRARIRGWKFRYTPKSVVHHIHCGSSVEWSPFFLYHVERNRVLANVKCAPPKLALRVFTSFCYRALRKWALVATLRERSERDRGHAVAYAKAMFSLAWEVPGMLWKRCKVRGWRRIVSDRAFAHLIAPNP